MSVEQGNAETDDVSVSDELGSCLYDLLQKETLPNWCNCSKEGRDTSSTQRRLESMLAEAGNRLCADCGARDPKMGVLSVKLDEWTDEQVDALIEIGGNAAVNSKYEAYVPDNYKKLKPDSSIEERDDFIRRKYDMQQFFNHDFSSSFQSPSSTSRKSSFGCDSQSVIDNMKHLEKQTTDHRIQGLGHAFRNSWRRSEHKAPKKTNSMAVVRGTKLAVRDLVTSDPYVILSLGNQSMKTRVIKKNLNPVLNERLMLSIPENIPPSKLDKDKFTTAEFMGEAEIDIQPPVSDAKLLSAPRLTSQCNLESGKQAKRTHL